MEKEITIPRSFLYCDQFQLLKQKYLNGNVKRCIEKVITISQLQYFMLLLIGFSTIIFATIPFISKAKIRVDSMETLDLLLKIGTETKNL